VELPRELDQTVTPTLPLLLEKLWRRLRARSTSSA
jgi:hypothetical protein